MDYDVGRNAWPGPPSFRLCSTPRRLTPPLLISILIRRHLIRPNKEAPTPVRRVYFKRRSISSNSLYRPSSEGLSIETKHSFVFQR